MTKASLKKGAQALDLGTSGLKESEDDIACAPRKDKASGKKNAISPSQLIILLYHKLRARRLTADELRAYGTAASLARDYSWLVACDLLKSADSEDDEDDSSASGSHYHLSDRGHALIDHILATPLPKCVSSWSVERNDDEF